MVNLVKMVILVEWLIGPGYLDKPLVRQKTAWFRQTTADLRLRFATSSIFGFFLPEAKKVAPGPRQKSKWANIGGKLKKASKHTPGVNSGSKKTLPL